MLAARLGTAKTSSLVRLFSRGMSSNTEKGVIKFGPFEVTDQVFLKTSHSFGLVNLKPLVPGHVLVCPLIPHRRLTDLSPPEVSDLFTSVQLTQRMLAKMHFPLSSDITSGSFNIAVQDGAEAGQTVPHVHVHVIARVNGDMERPDDLYVKMAGEEGNVGGALWDSQRPKPGGGMPRIEDEDRAARTKGEMSTEADMYRKALEDMGGVWKTDRVDQK